MPAARGKFSPLLAPGLAVVFFKKLQLRPAEWQTWINKKTSKRAFEEEYKLTGLGPFVRKAEGGIYTFDEPVSGDKVRYDHLTYGLGFRVTMEMFEDDLYGVMNRMSGELGKSARVNKELRAASVLNNAFDSNFTGFDGQPLCDTAHPNLGENSTQANRAGTDADLAQASLQAAIEIFENWTDDRGVPIVISPKKLLINTGDIWEAGQLLESDKDPDTANNAKNIIRSRYGISDQVLHYLTDPDSWFLIGPKEDHDMKLYLRKDDTFKNADDEITGDAIFTGHHRLSTGFSDWRGIFGSTGA